MSECLSKYYRYVGWRPVGSPPIFSPAYAKPHTIRADAQSGTPPHFSSAHWDDDVRASFRKAEFRARYDGLYVADLYFDDTATPELSPEAGSDREALFLDRAAEQISMVISEELGHCHYFHAPKKPSAPSVPWLKSILPLTAIAAVILCATYFLNGRLPLAWLLVSMVAVCTFLALAACILMLSFSNISHDKLSPDRVLRLRPIRVSVDQEHSPLAELCLDGQSFFSLATCRKPEQALSSRLIVGQLRRHIIKVHERVTKLVAQAKKSDSRWMSLGTKVFWFAFFLAILGTITPMLFGLLRPDLPLSVIRIGLALATVLLATAVLSLVYLILCVDLPRVKLLRSTVGFITSCEPLNDIISQVLRDSGNKHWELKSAPSFSSIVGTTKTQLEGESQRLQVRQFWVAALGTAVGALVAALAITFSLPAKSDISLICEISPADTNGTIIQKCHPQTNPSP